MSFLLHMNDFSYTVEDASLEKVEALIIDAVQVGGAFVDLHDTTAHKVRVLVTPSSTVRIQKVPHHVEPDDEEYLFPDFDFYDLDL